MQTLPTSYLNPYLAALGILLFFGLLIRQTQNVLRAMFTPSMLMRQVERVANSSKPPKQQDQLENYLKSECKKFLVPALMANSIHELTGAELLESMRKMRSAAEWASFVLGEVVLSMFPSYALAAEVKMQGAAFRSLTFYLGGSIGQLSGLAQAVEIIGSSWVGWLALLLFLALLYLFASQQDTKQFGTIPRSTQLLLGVKAIYDLSGAILKVVRSITRGLYEWVHSETRFTVVQPLESSQLKSILNRVMIHTGTGERLAFVEYSPLEDGDILKHADEFLDQYVPLFTGIEPRKVSTMMVQRSVSPDELVKRLRTAKPTYRLGVVDGRCAFLAWTRYDFRKRVRKTLFFLDSSDVASHLKAGLKALEDEKEKAFGESGIRPPSAQEEF